MGVTLTRGEHEIVWAYDPPGLKMEVSFLYYQSVLSTFSNTVKWILQIGRSFVEVNYF